MESRSGCQNLPPTRQRGAVLVELAIVLLFLITLLAGLVESFQSFNDYVVMLNAARTGARAGAQCAACILGSSVKTVAEEGYEQARNYLNDSGVDSADFKIFSQVVTGKAGGLAVAVSVKPDSDRRPAFFNRYFTGGCAFSIFKFELGVVLDGAAEGDSYGVEFRC